MTQAVHPGLAEETAAFVRRARAGGVVVESGVPTVDHAENVSASAPVAESTEA
jgi:hypothetical protein